PGAVVHRREIADEREAAQAGMHGSPTLLIDGVDPFAAPGQPPSLSCRLYRDATGRAEGAPSVEGLRRALEKPTAQGQPADWRRPLRHTKAGQPGRPGQPGSRTTGRGACTACLLSLTSRHDVLK